MSNLSNDQKQKVWEAWMDEPNRPPWSNCEHWYVQGYIAGMRDRDNDAGRHEAGRDDARPTQQLGVDKGPASIRGHRLDGNHTVPASPLPPASGACMCSAAIRALRQPQSAQPHGEKK